jgi:catechol-2,3-dioxygenase
MHIVDLRLLTDRLAALRAFYAGALGLSVIEEDTTSFTLQAGATRLVFAQTLDETPVYHFAFNIPENQLAAAKTWLSRSTPLLMRDGTDQFATETWNSEQIYFADPAGNAGELIARHTLPNGADGVFGPGSILGVSEIGLPVDDVPATVAGLRAVLGLGVYGEGSDTFTPVGDEHGLFIVVERPRPWFSTGLAATTHETAVTIRAPGASAYRVPGFPYRIAVAE